jgi:hypothetical protein
MPVDPTNYLITTDGELISKSKLTIRNRSYGGSYINVVLEGERVNANLADLMWEAFIDVDAEPQSYYFVDGDYSNCAINNLELKIKKQPE